MPIRAWLLITLGTILMALGAFVAVRPLFTHGAVLTGARWLDVTFAFVFLLRGWMNVSTGLRRKRATESRWGPLP